MHNNIRCCSGRVFSGSGTGPFCLFLFSLLLVVSEVTVAATTRVSTDSSNQEDNASNYNPSVSADGRYAVFHSNDTSLVAGDSNGVTDIFLKDTQTGVVTLISPGISGQSNGHSKQPRISADGKFVTFQSAASNLVTGDGNGTDDIFLYDVQTPGITRVSTDSAGLQAGGHSREPDISDDGRYVVFYSYASDLLPAGQDTNGQADVFLKDTGDASTTRVSTTDGANAEAVGGASIRPRISADGRYVVFASNATNLVAGGTGGGREIFVKDTQTSATIRVSVEIDAGNPLNNWCFAPRISADGRYVVFYSAATNLVANDANGHQDIFIRDIVTGVTSLVSTDSSGLQASNSSAFANLSSDGRYVVFDSLASNLVANDTNPTQDVFIKDTHTGVTVRVSTDDAGIQGNGISLNPDISQDGSFVVFESDATNLDPPDGNGVRDIFRVDNPFPVIPPRVSLDTDNSSGATGGGYATRFLVGNTANVTVADADAAITDADSAELSALTVTLTNPQGNDALAAGNIYGGIQISSTAQQIQLSGSASLADYVNTLKEITFSTDATAPPGTRLVSVTPTDDTGYSGISAAASIEIAGGLTISVEEIPQLTLANDDLSYMATVTNNDLSDATGVTISVILPDTVTFNSFSGANLSDWDCNLFGNTAICSYVPVLASGASASLSYDFTAPAETSQIQAQFSVGNGTTDSYALDNTAVSTFLVVDYAGGGFVPDEVLAGNGTAYYDHSGSSVALAGEQLVVGVPDYDINDTGAVYAWQRQGNDWQSGQTIQAAVPDANARFGAAVSIDGSTLVVGAPSTGSSGEAGAVFIFDWDGSNWVQQQKLLASDGVADDEFGYAVSLTGDVLLVGAPGRQVDGYADSGMVYAFRRAAGGFVETSTISPLAGTAAYPYEGRFGAALDSAHGTMLAGAPGATGVIEYGRALVFVEDNGSWNFQQELTTAIASPEDLFGRAVALQGDYAVIGAQYNTDGGLDSGAVHIYSRSGVTWSFQQRLQASDAVSFEEFGSSIDIEGETLIVGAPGARTAESTGQQAGSTYIFQLDEGVWAQQQKLSYPDPYTIPPEIEFGTAVAISGDTFVAGAPMIAVDGGGACCVEHGIALLSRASADTTIQLVPQQDAAEFGTGIAMSGDTLLVGAPREGEAGCIKCGAVYFYVRTGSSWDLQQRVTGALMGVAQVAASDGAGFGEAVALSGDTAVIGASRDDVNESGAAYVLKRTGETWGLDERLVPDVSVPETDNDWFGYAVGIQGSTILIGAPMDEDFDGDLQGGSVYRFEEIADDWVQQQKLYGDLTEANNYFGYAVAIEGDTLVVGAPGHLSIPTTSQGVIYPFNTVSWTQSQAAMAVSNTEGFGNSIGLYRSGVPDGGGWMVVGAAFGGTPDAFRYRKNLDSDPWVFDAGLGSVIGITPAGSSGFGNGVATDGETEVVGQPNDNSFLSDSGSVYVGYRDQNYQLEYAADAQADDRYGWAVIVNQDAMVVSAPFEDGVILNSNTGKVYIYPRSTTASIHGGIYNSEQVVELFCNSCGLPGNEIWYTYTENGDDPVKGGAGSFLYIGAIPITGTTILKYATFDSNGVLRETVKTEEFIIDTVAPWTVIASPAGGAIVTDINPVDVTLSGTANDAGSGLFLVQVQVRDITDPQNEVLITGNLWQTATLSPPNPPTTTDWQWSLDLNDANTSQVLVSEHDYIIEARAFDVVGNVSQVVSSQFTYYNGTPAFTTTSLTLNASSILFDGSVDVTIKLDEPGSPVLDFTGSRVDLVITEPCPAANPGCTPVETAITCDTNSAGVVDMDELGSGVNYPGCDPTSSVAFDQKGTWTLQARFNEDDSDYTRLASNSPLRSLLVGSAAGYAVLVQGRIVGDAGWEAHNKTANRIYNTLRERLFQADDIWYFNPDVDQNGVLGTPTEPDDNPAAGIDGKPTQANIAAVFTDTGPGSLAERVSNSPAPVYVIMVDHGGLETFYLDPDAGGEAQEITPTELNGWLTTLEGNLDTLNGGAAADEPRIAILGMCYSGSFIQGLSGTLGRTIITSADSNEVSYKGAKEADDIRVGEYFLEEFFLADRAGV